MLGGFDFTLNPQMAGVSPQQASISDMKIESRATVSSPAAKFTWSTYQANAQGSFWASDLNITRKDDGTGSFSAGIELSKCFVGFIDRCVIVGDDARTGNHAVKLVDCVGIRISDCDMNRYKEGVRIDIVSAMQTEGIFIQNSFLYDVNIGLNAPSKSLSINLVNSHININGAGAACAINLVQASQCSILGNLLYVGGVLGDPVNQDCVRLTTACNSNRIAGNQMNSLSILRGRFGVLTSAGCSYNAIEDNNINGFQTGVSLAAAGDTGNRVVDNDFFGDTININDIGTNTYKVGNTAAGIPISSVRWGAAAGSFGVGEISSNASWGAFIRGRSGTAADIGLTDSSNVTCAYVKSGVFAVHTYVKAALPTAVLINGGTGIIGVSDDVGGFVLAFSDGTNWRRVTDRAIVA